MLSYSGWLRTNPRTNFQRFGWYRAAVPGGRYSLWKDVKIENNIDAPHPISKP
jgi:hypothetical protein